MKFIQDSKLLEAKLCEYRFEEIYHRTKRLPLTL